ncbi:uncharacterized protein LOC126749169 [Anthonomus grandis grandis]|uniref:uncharacterized protein LOC126749169 n=1 Tax=Anthonomus grandis grandis TaxID=2921223 RepID=UPI0021659F20|nr:uncharacterized protein LOC126749169 [Anthonomus grandis grandis]
MSPSEAVITINLEEETKNGDDEGFKLVSYKKRNHNRRPSPIKDVEVLLNDVSADCLCINEHWLVPNELYSITIKNYQMVSGFSRSVMTHGGVSIYIKEPLSSVSLNLENLSIKKHCEVTGILLDIHDMQLVTVYRTPDGDFDQFFSAMVKAFKKLDVDKPLIITGDFNVHFGKRDIRALELCNFFRSFNLRKSVRFNTLGNNCLDNVFTNIDCSLLTSEPVDLTHTSDHKGILFKCQVARTNFKTRINYRPITDVGLSTLCNTMSSLDFDIIDNMSLNVDLRFQLFIDSINDAIKFSFPEKSRLLGHDKSPRVVNWFDGNLRDMRERLRFLVSLHKRDPILVPKEMLSDYRKRYRHAIKNAKIKSNDDFIMNSR